ncbi:UvrD-helicase domain-containing protein [Flagellimonas meishanensis]|uniref:UvrD-helicase domain-containing protein n=1 Tax=Flagellimonas meishanensis TaxID=2873264 RepID=UPI001CA7B66F|nr:UvrD-helicase domain-containing protein [[Muricauda] meishanensis]
MEDSCFKIFSASAGSGKTYALAKQYLKLLLSHPSPSGFRQILAMTFTNKAVSEMKTRILDQLHAFGNDPTPKNQIPLFLQLCEELGMDEKQLRARANLVLKLILHNYSFFEISTIDKFNHKIIKTFARDLHLSQNFEVELDTDLLLEEAVGRLLERTGTDQQLTEALIAFSLEKIDDDKSWNIAFDLKEIGKLLFQENHAAHVEALRSKSIDDFREIQKNLASQIDAMEQKARAEAANVLQEIRGQGFDFEDFPRKTLPNHFQKIMEGKFNPRELYTSKTLEPNLIEGKILKANDNRDVSVLSNTILTAYLSIKKYIYRHSYLKNMYGNIVPMTVLNEIAKEIKNIELERDITPISSFNTILSKEIKNQPVPFIYERMGEKYRHYFVDEFQDTSRMQWENLIPLIGNALESENERSERGSLFLVGDVKQAIYRWRGGRTEQFLNLINTRTNPFVVAPTVHSLDTNWRSLDEIVGFNNAFFAAVAPTLENEDYRNLFLKDSHQKTNNKPGGFVQLTFLEKNGENQDAVYCEKVLSTINYIVSADYTHSDICVLVRDNKKGVLLANFLAQNNVPIISSDALLLNKNENVAFLIAVLRVFENEQDLEAAYLILRYLCQDKSDRHGFISKNLFQIADFLSSEHGFNIGALKGHPVLTILENAIVQFKLANDAPAHIVSLMDTALEIEKRKGPSVHAFLNYWEVKKETLSIAAPEGVDAVNIMTIHKAKGLEFPFVIFPFANTLLDDKRKKKKIWAPSSNKDIDLGLEEFLINSTRDMLTYDEEAAQIYIDEEQKSILDAMNVLYVALTRPVMGLYIFTDEAKPLASINEASSYSDLFQWYVQQVDVPKNADLIYTLGAFPQNLGTTDKSTTSQQDITYITRGKGDSEFAISTKTGRLWDDERLEAIEKGNLIHFALSQIHTLEDIPKVIKMMLDSGDLPQASAEEIKQKILDVVTHPHLKAYYSAGVQILNEREILTRTGVSLRPDRITISRNRATIIDYKTGSPIPKHKAQLIHYKEVIEEMDFEIENAIIVYIDEKINPVFV